MFLESSREVRTRNRIVKLAQVAGSAASDSSKAHFLDTKTMTCVDYRCLGTDAHCCGRRRFAASPTDLAMTGGRGFVSTLRHGPLLGLVTPQVPVISMSRCGH